MLDAYGNVVTGYRGKVHLASTDAKGGSSDYTFSNSDNGVQWRSELDQSVPSTDPQNPFPMLISIAATPAKSYRPGGTYRETSNQGVFGPSFPARDF